MKLVIGESRHFTHYPFDRVLDGAETKIVEAAAESVFGRGNFWISSGSHSGLNINNEVMHPGERAIKVAQFRDLVGKMSLVGS